MKLRIKFKQQVPYGGMWYWKDPVTGVECRATNINALMDRIYAERRANGAPIGLGLEEEVERDLCRDFPAECEIDDPRFVTRRSLGLADVVRGTKVMVAHKLAGSPLVDRAEAERRAQICLQCPFNTVFSKPCSGVCAELKEIVSSITDHQGTRFDADLKACNICGCFLQAAIWLPLDIQCKGIDDTMRERFGYVPNCWKNCPQPS